MIDTKEKVTNNILEKMMPYLSDEAMLHLQNTLLLIFYDVDMTIPERSLTVYENNDRNLVEQYYIALKMEGKSQKTIERYLYLIKQMLTYIDKHISDITTEDIRYYLLSYQQKRKVSNTTLGGVLKCLKAFFNWLEENDYIYKSPCKKLKNIKNDTIKEDAFSVGELEKMMLSCKSMRDKALLSFAYETAARADEISQVKLTEIDLIKKEVLLHGKGDKDRISYFTDKTVLYVSEYLKHRKYESEYLFCASRAPYNKMTVSGLERIFSKIGKDSDIQVVHPHRFRVTRISHLAARGMPLQDIQAIAGHSNINTTMGYVRMIKDNVKNSYNKLV